MKKTVISKWKHKPFQMAVYLVPNGKKVNGKPAYRSITKHESVSKGTEV